jgi:hypothetical protein
MKYSILHELASLWLRHIACNISFVCVCVLEQFVFIVVLIKSISLAIDVMLPRFFVFWNKWVSYFSSSCVIPVRHLPFPHFVSFQSGTCLFLILCHFSQALAFSSFCVISVRHLPFPNFVSFQSGTCLFLILCHFSQALAFSSFCIIPVRHLPFPHFV